MNVHAGDRTHAGAEISCGWRLREICTPSATSIARMTNYVVAHAEYSRALARAEKVATLEDNGRSLVVRIRKNQQAVSEIPNGGEKGRGQVSSEELQVVFQ